MHRTEVEKAFPSGIFLVAEGAGGERGCRVTDKAPITLEPVLPTEELKTRLEDRRAPLVGVGREVAQNRPHVRFLGFFP